LKGFGKQTRQSKSDIRFDPIKLSNFGQIYQIELDDTFWYNNRRVDGYRC